MHGGHQYVCGYLLCILRIKLIEEAFLRLYSIYNSYSPIAFKMSNGPLFAIECFTKFVLQLLLIIHIWAVVFFVAVYFICNAYIFSSIPF